MDWDGIGMVSMQGEVHVIIQKLMIFPHQPNGEPPLGGCDRLHSHHKVPIIQVPKRILIEFQKRILIELQKLIIIELRNKRKF